MKPADKLNPWSENRLNQARNLQAVDDHYRHDHSHACHEEACACHHSEVALDHLHYHHGLEIVFEGEVSAEIHRVWESLVSDNLIRTELTWTHRAAGGYLTYQPAVGETIEFMVMDVEAPVLLSFSWLHQAIITVTLSEVGNSDTRIRLVIWLPDEEDVDSEDLVEWVWGLKRIESHLLGTTLEMGSQESAEIHQQVKQLLRYHGEDTFLS